MVAATIVGISMMAVAFMAVFFVGICTDGSRIKVCEVLKVDTERSAPSDTLWKVEPESPRVDSDVSYSANNVLTMPTSRAHDRSTHARPRKPA
jgi:hypothetical protein